MGVATVAERKVSLEAVHLEDIRLAASKMTGAKRRAFQAEMALKYCGGSARRAEDVFGWSRQAVQLGLLQTMRHDLHERGIIGQKRRLTVCALCRR